MRPSVLVAKKKTKLPTDVAAGATLVCIIVGCGIHPWSFSFCSTAAISASLFTSGCFIESAVSSFKWFARSSQVDIEFSFMHINWITLAKARQDLEYLTYVLLPFLAFPLSYP